MELSSTITPAPISFTRQLLLMFLLAGVFFTAITPTLRWPQFSGDSEDNLVQTVLEMRHGGTWWVPTLGGVPRLRKPPLAAWIAAAAVSPNTVYQLDSTDPDIRQAAYHDLAFQIRWPSLAAGSLMLVAAGLFGRIVAGPTCGFLTLLIFASSLACLRFVRVATTDVQLALWVTVTNLGLATALLAKRPWLGFSIAGVALGLGLLSKDPVAPAQTVLPAAVFAIAQHLIDRRAPDYLPGDSSRWRRLPFPILFGIALCLAVALPWWIDTYLHHPELTAELKKEVTAEGANNISHDPVWAYLILLPLHMLPWLPLFIAGIYVACQLARRNRGLLFSLIWMILPLIVMTFHPNRKDRYVLPVAAPAAVLTAYAAMEVMKYSRARDRGEQIVRWSHWGIMIAFAAGLPLACVTLLKTVNGATWYTPSQGALLLAGGALIVGTGTGLYRRLPAMLIVTGAAVMLWLNTPFIRGWSQSAAGVSDMKPIADRLQAYAPTGTVIYYEPPTDKVGKPVTMDLDIYLNRVVPVVKAVPPAPSAGLAAMVVLQRDPRQPAPTFDGWTELFPLVTPKHHYLFRVFVPE